MARNNREISSPLVQNYTIEETETSVGLDIDYESFTPDYKHFPTNEGIKMIYFGTKWW